MTMDDEEFMPPPRVSPLMRVAALTMTGDLILAFGFVFMLLGIASFVTDLLGVKGAGEFLVGLALCIIAIVILAVSRKQMGKAVPPSPPQPPTPEGMDKRDESASYR